MKIIFDSKEEMDRVIKKMDCPSVYGFKDIFETEECCKANCKECFKRAVEVEVIEQTKNECSTKGNMIIGDGKIEMSESDFIELTTRLGNDIDVCSFEGNNCVNGCAWCWSKYLNKFINI